MGGEVTMKRSIRLIQVMVMTATWKLVDLVETRALESGRKWGE